MVKHYFTIACAAFMLTAAQAQTPDLLKQGSRNATELPQAVRFFLASEQGQGFTEQQFIDALGHNTATETTTGSNIQYTEVMREDFSKWTAGAEGSPDATDATEDSTALQSLMAIPGDWMGLMAYQAGGMAYLGYDSQHGPGYLKSCFLDLRGTNGVFRIRMRARTDNPDNEDQMLQIFNFDEAQSSILNAQAQAIGKDWADLEWLFSGGAEQTSVMFYGNSGKIYVDDLVVETVTYPLETPANIDCELTDANEVTVTWDAVEGATSYYVYAEDSDQDDLRVAEATVTGTEAKLNFTVVGETYYHIFVIAKNGDDESYPKSWWGTFEPAEIETPVALAATNVTDHGFTANWEKATNASQYIVAVNQIHVATADGETFDIFDDDFSALDDATEEAVLVAQLSYCDKYFKRGGWYGDVVAGYYGMIALTNLYAGYGLPGSITSPAMNFGVGDGTVSVSGTAMTLVDDAVLSIAYKDGSKTVGEQTVDVPQTGTQFSVDITGGGDGYKLCLSVADAAEGGDYIFLDDLKMTVTMNNGEKIELPYTSTYVAYPATSLDVEIPLAGDDNASYTVQGYFSDEVMGEVSNEIYVKKPTSITAMSLNGTAARVYSNGGMLCVANPDGAEIKVYSADGRLVAHSNGNAKNSSFGLNHGTYIVRVGSQTFKIAK